MGALWGLASGLADFSFLDFDNITISNSTNAKIKINVCIKSKTNFNISIKILRLLPS